MQDSTPKAGPSPQVAASENVVCVHLQKFWKTKMYDVAVHDDGGTTAPAWGMRGRSPYKNTDYSKAHVNP